MEGKEIVQKIVRTALQRFYPDIVTKEQYADVNRTVSRKLYDKITDPDRLDDKAREEWERFATTEVEKAVESLKST
jgi:hypothetical protein